MAIVTTGLLFAYFTGTLGIDFVELLNQASTWLSGRGLSPLWSWALTNGAFNSVGMIPAALLFRWVGGIGWKCRCRWMHLLVGAALVIGLDVCAKVVQLNGYVTVYEANAMKMLLLFTIGFGWHVFAQKRAEARHEADAIKAEVDTFA